MEKYKILEQIGQGGTGSVYLVWDSHLDKKWVMKEIVFTEEEPWKKESADREIAVLKQLKNPGIPMLADVVREPGRVCLVMEYMEGRTLEEELADGGRFPERKAIETGLKMAELLAFLHHASPKIIYGDVKPANFIWRKGVLSLLDFGAAMWEGRVQEERVWLTYGYASPEQKKGSVLIDERSDIYGWGVTMFCLLTGEDPGSAPYLIRPVREAHPFLSPVLERILEKCTRENREDRYASMDEVMSELTNISRGKRNGFWRKDRRKAFLFQTEKRIFLTGKNRFGLFLLGAAVSAAVLCGMKLTGQAGEETLPVCIRNRAGEKILVQYESVYHTDENPVFELPVSCFERGQEHEVTIRKTNRKTGEMRERTFVICAD